ncbi:MAG: metallophosphoesterase [Hyphomonadaceae bacterium]
MRILHLSDLHFGYADESALAAVRAFALAAPPDLVIASGDLSAAGLQKELDACAAWLAGLGAPVVVTPGNHDVPYFEVFPRFYRPFRRFRAAAAAHALAMEWRDARVCVVTLNSARGWQARLNWALGAINPLQTSRAARVLHRAPAGALKIVVTHHPLIFPPHPALTGRTHGGAAAMRALIEAGAHLFLAGHLHVLRDFTHTHAGRAALALTGGTLSARLRGDPQGFNVITHEAAGVRVERFAIEAGVIRPLACVHAGLAGGRLQPPPA